MRSEPAIWRRSDRVFAHTATDMWSDENNAKDFGRGEFELNDAEVDTFARDGFVVIDRLIDPELARRALARYEALFAGRFETGLYPDEWNWRTGVSPPDLTRQICNAWKSDRTIARVVPGPTSVGPVRASASGLARD